MAGDPTTIASALIAFPISESFKSLFKGLNDTASKWWELESIAKKAASDHGLLQYLPAIQHSLTQVDPNSLAFKKLKELQLALETLRTHAIDGATSSKWYNRSKKANIILEDEKHIREFLKRDAILMSLDKTLKLASSQVQLQQATSEAIQQMHDSTSEAIQKLQESQTQEFHELDQQVRACHSSSVGLISCATQQMHDAQTQGFQQLIDLSGSHSRQLEMLKQQLMIEAAPPSPPVAMHYFSLPLSPSEPSVIGIEDCITSLEALLLDESKCRWISVSGAGGLGKSFLVQLVCQRPTVKAHFKDILWVEIGYDIAKVQLLQLQTDLFSYFTRKNVREFRTQGQGKQALTNFIGQAQNKYLLVLDNVWKRNIIEPLDFLEKSEGSKIIITSRKKGILSGVPSIQIEMQPLSEEDGYKLFCIHAFSDNHGDVPPHLTYYVRKLVHECNGVPLVLRVMARFMQRDTTQLFNPGYWQHILRKAKGRKLDCEDNEELYELLRFSYDDLNDGEKLLFLCIGMQFMTCNSWTELLYWWRVLSRNFSHSSEVEFWYALGRLIDAGLINLTTEVNRALDAEASIGDFFEVVDKQWQFIPGFSVEGFIGGLANYIIRIDKLPYYCYSSGTPPCWESIQAAHGQADMIHKVVHRSAEHTEVLDLHAEVFRNPSIPNGFLDNFPNLKLLSLKGCFHWGQESVIRSSLQSLVQLRYLTLENQGFSECLCTWGDLAAALKNLTQLELLHIFGVQHDDADLCDCNSSFVIDLAFMECMPHLRDVEVYSCDCHKLKNLRYVQKLIHLRNLRFSSSPCENFEDWYCQALQQSLEVFALGDVIDESIGAVAVTGEANRLMKSIHGSQRLTRLRLGHVQITKLPAEINFPCLCTLQLRAAVKSLPRGFESLPCLTKLDLDGCGILTELPSLEKLQCLKNFKLQGWIGEGFKFSEGEAFASLEVLDITNCENVDKLPSIQGLLELTLRTLPSLVQVGPMPILTSLKILSCEKLMKISECQAVRKIHLEGLASMREICSDGCEAPFPLLTNLSIFNCQQLTSLPSEAPSLERIEVAHCNKLASTGRYPCMTDMLVSNCEELVSNISSTSFPSLTYMSMSHCNKVDKLPPVYGIQKLCLESLESLDEIGATDQDYPSLKRMWWVSRLPKVVRPSAFPALRTLEIWKNNSLQHIPESITAFDNLSALIIAQCHNLVTILVDETQFSSFSKLKCLHLHDLPSLVSIPESVETLPCLRRFDVHNCPNVGEYNVGFCSHYSSFSMEEYVESI